MQDQARRAHNRRLRNLHRSLLRFGFYRRNDCLPHIDYLDTIT